jgi:transcription antitermination factor NusG
VRTKGGEALPDVTAAPQWRVLWTRSNCEQLVHDQLARKGFDLFLPIVETWVKHGRERRRHRAPLFSGYVFLRHAVDKATYLEVCKTRGLVRLLGERWDQLDAVPDSDIESIQRIVQSDVPILPHPYLREGQRIRITRGPLADIEGILVRANPKTGLLVVSVHMLQRSIAVHLDCTQLEAA